MKKPRITFLTDRMIKGHGVDLVVDRIADGLAKKGYFTEVYANLVDETFTDRKSYKIYRLPPIGLGNAYVLEKRVRKFADFLNSRDTDLFIIQSFPFYSLIPKLKKPSLVVDHGIIKSEGLPLKRRLVLKYMQLSQDLSYFRKAKKVVCVSEYLLKQLPAAIQKKSTYIYNGIDHYSSARFSEEDIKDFRYYHNLSESDVLLLYVGRLNLTNQPYKGLAELLSIYHDVSLQNPDIKLLAVGYGSKNDEEFLKNQGVLCIANAPEDQMPLIYSASDIYTTCSHWEGFDLPVGEAQYFRKPVVCYDIGAHPEIMENGKTGYIVSAPEEFAEKIRVLCADKGLREYMGAYAGQFVKKFYWQNSIDAYDLQIRQILGLGSAELPVYKSQPPGEVTEQKASEALEGIEKAIYKKVTAIIVNYNSSYQCLRECLDSLLQQSYKNMDILIYDNGSSNNTLGLIAESYKNISILKSDKNLGLGEAINQAIKNTESDYILISNFDVAYDKIAVEELVEDMAGLENKYVGLAPKIKLYYQREYIESVGVYVDNNFYLGFNGMGQLDLDQYNKPEDVFGVSFTSAFLKRDYLFHSTIGTIDKPIDPGYFLFYEDIDFCYRANLAGYRFKSCPTAVCYHKYAFSFRNEATAFTEKYYYQKLNVMKLAYKNAETHNMKRIIKNEISIQKSNLKDRNLKAVASNILHQWRKGKGYLKKYRTYIQITRQVPDSEIIKYSWGEKNFFDVVNNEPQYCIENLILTYKRLFIITGNRKYEEYINYLEALNSTRFKIEPAYLRQFLHGKLEYEPKPIHDFINRIG
ncbi:MAG: glycosyltransferase [Actinobacteria bacterium]|nr:glycosyltransferase [Actinomycetota bacterium]